MNKKFLMLFVVSTLAACQAGPKGEDPANAPLAGAKMGGPFTLTNQDGQKISDSAFKGKYRLIYFGYAFCPDVCPVDLQVLSQGLARFEKEDPARAAKIVPIFISVDPARDTPKVIKEFISNFHPRLVGLTGGEQEIADLAKAYGIYFEKGEANAEGGYLVNHSNFPALYDPDGKPLAPLPHDKGPQAVAAELSRWVR